MLSYNSPHLVVGAVLKLDADIDIALKMTKLFGIKYMDLRKIHHDVMCRIMEHSSSPSSG